MLNLTAFAAKTRKNIWILHITQLRAKIISQGAENEFQSWQVPTETLRYGNLNPFTAKVAVMRLLGGASYTGTKRIPRPNELIFTSFSSD